LGKRLKKKYFFLLSCFTTLLGCRVVNLPATPPPPPLAPTPAPVAAESYLEVDAKSRIIRLCKGTEVVNQFQQIRLGTAGAGLKKRVGDGITPVGAFTVGWINNRSKFRVFIGINYPSLSYATSGLAAGKITQQEFKQIEAALIGNKRPPQNTALGGMIGIHGVGNGSIKVHRMLNWTDGCIALENNQIRELAKLVYPGMKVIIYERVEGHCLNAQPRSELHPPPE